MNIHDKSSAFRDRVASQAAYRETNEQTRDTQLISFMIQLTITPI